MSKLLYDIIPPKAKSFYRRNSGRIAIGGLVLFVIASLFATGYLPRA